MNASWNIPAGQIEVKNLTVTWSDGVNSVTSVPFQVTSVDIRMI